MLATVSSLGLTGEHGSFCERLRRSHRALIAAAMVAPYQDSLSRLTTVHDASMRAQWYQP